MNPFVLIVAQAMGAVGATDGEHSSNDNETYGVGLRSRSSAANHDHGDVCGGRCPYRTRMFEHILQAHPIYGLADGTSESYLGKMELEVTDSNT